MLPPDDIVLVSGLPRSGTSLMMQMLAAGGVPILSDDIRAADDSNPRGYLELEAVKHTRRDASWVAGAGGRAVKVISLLLEHLPTDHAYRVIFMRRDLGEVIRSQRVMLERLEQKGAALPEATLRSAYEAQYRAAEAWCAGPCAAAVLDVDYNALMEDPEPVVEAVADFVGGPLDREAMRAVIDPSLYRQRADPGAPDAAP